MELKRHESKEVLLQVCKDLGIHTNSSDSKADLKSKIQSHFLFLSNWDAIRGND